MKSPKKSSKKKVVQVGRSKIWDKKARAWIICKYAHVPTDDNGWVVDPHYLPIDFDMMDLRITGKTRAIPAWWDGQRWVGLRLREGNEITAWRRNIVYD